MTSPFWKLDDKPKFWSLDEPSPEAETAMGRLGMEAQGRAQEIEALKKSLAQPGITAERRAMLQRVIANLERGGAEPGIKGVIKSFERSVTKGALQGLVGLSELPLKGIELGQRLLPGEFEPTGKIRELRRGIQETQAQIEEQFPTKPGAVDIGGRLIGGIAAAGPAWASIARGTGLAALKILPAGHPLARAITAGITGTAVQRVVGQELINIPVDALDAIDQLDATTQQRLLSLGIAVGGTALGAALTKPKIPATPSLDVGPVKEVDLGIPTKTQGAPSEATLGELQAASKRIAENQALLDATKAARKEFKKLYPELKWKDLTSEQQAEWIQSLKTAGPRPEEPVIQPKAKPMTSEQAAKGLADLAEEIGEVPSTKVKETLPSVAPAQQGMLRHGTEIDEAVGIIESGLRPGSSVDVGSRLSEGQTVLIEFESGPTKPYPSGELASEGSATTIGSTGPIKKIYFDPEAYVHVEDAKQAYERLQNAVKKAGLKTKIESMQYDENKDKWTFGGPVKFKPAKAIGTYTDRALETRANELIDAIDAVAEPRAGVLREQFDAIIDEAQKRGLDWAKDLGPRENKLGQLATEAEAMVAKNEEILAQSQKIIEREAALQTPQPPPILRTIQVIKPLVDHSLEELAGLNRQLKDAIEANPKLARSEDVQADMLGIALAKRELARRAKAVGIDPASAVFKPKEVVGEERAQPVVTPEVEAPPKAPEVIVAPAIRTKDGKVYQGAIHLMARDEARKAGSLGPDEGVGLDEGFVTSYGRYVDRTEAEAIQAAFEGRAVRAGAGSEFDAVDISTVSRGRVEAKEVIPTPEPSLVTPTRSYNPNELRSFYMANLRTMKPDDLAAHRADVESRIDATLDPMPYQKRLDAILAEIARRENPPRDGGALLQSPPEIGGSIIGLITGWMTGDDPDEKMRNALIGMSLGLGGTLGYRYKSYRSTAARPRPHFKGEEAVGAVVVSTEELKHGEKAFKPFAGKTEMEFEGMARPGIVAQKATRLAGGRNLMWSLNFGKQSVEGADALNASLPYVIGEPTIHKLTGEYVRMSDVPNLHTILASVDGDATGLGNVSFALHVIEKADKYGKLEPRLSPEQALRYLSNVPQKYIDAARQFRRLSSVLVEQGVELEMITRDVADKMLAEQDYTPILRIYDEALLRSAEQVDLSASKKRSVGAPQPFKERKGTKRDYQVLNPIEAFTRNLVKYNWAFAEQRRRLTLLAMREAERIALKAEGKNPDDAALGVLVRRTTGSERGRDTERYLAHVQRIAEKLDLRESKAEQIFDSFNPKPVSDSDPHFGVWRNGVKETYNINPELAETFRLPSREAEALWFTALERLTKGVRFGVTRDPLFAMRMGIIDNWQSYLASNYGFRFGLDHFAGFLTLIGADKPASALSGVDVAEARRGYMLKRPAHLLSDVFKLDDPSALVKVAQQREISGLASIVKATKELKFGQVYNLLLSDIAEAGRMGLYLAATRKGASIDDAIYEATMAIGNYQTRGKRLEKLSRVALFLNPSVKAMDAELTAMGIGPGSRSYVKTATGDLKVQTKLFGVIPVGVPVDNAKALNYFAKGFTGITLPALALYYLNKDDPDIERLRKTDAGRRFFFIRIGNQIYRTRKSFISGQIFGTAMEEALDITRGTDPAGFDQFMQTLFEDVSLNVLPTGVGVGIALATDRDISTGIPLAGKALQDRLPAMRERATTSEPARQIGQMLEPLSTPPQVPEWLRTAMSPVGIDFLTRALGGTLAAESMQGLTMLHEWSQQNYLRPIAEMPLIRSAFGNASTVQAKQVEDFYNLVERVDQTMTTLNYLKSNPVRFAEFVERNRAYIALAPAVRDVRNEISQMRQSLEDVRTAPQSSINKAAKTKYRNAINKLIVQRIEFFVNSMSPVIKALSAQTK